MNCGDCGVSVAWLWAGLYGRYGLVLGLWAGLYGLELGLYCALSAPCNNHIRTVHKKEKKLNTGEKKTTKKGTIRLRNYEVG